MSREKLQRVVDKMVKPYPDRFVVFAQMDWSRIDDPNFSSEMVAQLDDAVKAIGSNVTGVQGDAGNLADLDRLYETVKKHKGKIDVLFASAGTGEFAPIGQVTEDQFDKTFGVNVRGPSSPSRRPCRCSMTADRLS